MAIGPDTRGEANTGRGCHGKISVKPPTIWHIAGRGSTFWEWASGGRGKGERVTLRRRAMQKIDYSYFPERE
jgi:hypothetical protein